MLHNFLVILGTVLALKKDAISFLIVKTIVMKFSVILLTSANHILLRLPQERIT